MKRRLKAYKKTVSIVDESTIALYESLGREKKGFLMESNDKENGRYTFMGVEPEALIQSDGGSVVLRACRHGYSLRDACPVHPCN